MASLASSSKAGKAPWAHQISGSVNAYQTSRSGGRMRTEGSELVWQGRLHVGDEPGVFGDAAYVGLAVELPLTVTPTPSSSAASETATAAVLTIRSESVQVIAPYLGHPVTVVAYHDGDTTTVGEGRITAPSDNQRDVDTDVALDVSALSFPAFLAVRIHVDSAVAPGLYDDFVVTRLRLTSADHALDAEIGFRS